MLETLKQFSETKSFDALLTFFFALLLAALVKFVLGRWGRRLAAKTKTDFDDRLIAAIELPLVLSIIMGGAWNTAQFYDLPEHIMDLTAAILKTIVVIIWTYAGLSFCSYLIEFMAEQPHRFKAVQPTTKPALKIMTKLLVLIIGAYFFIQLWGHDLTGWLASAGVAGIAIGFAAKDTLANFISGIFILADAPYKVGDYVVLGNGERGRVVDIGIRSTRLVTRDDVEIIIPNAIICNTEIINQSGGPHEKFRLKVPVGVAYGSDIDLVRDVLLQVAHSESRVQATPQPIVRMRAFGNSSLDFELMVWIEKPEFRGLVLDLMLTKVYKAFAENKIEIPFPKRDVYVRYMAPPSEIEAEDEA